MDWTRALKENKESRLTPELWFQKLNKDGAFHQDRAQRSSNRFHDERGFG